jgi:hypothetical protein
MELRKARVACFSSGHRWYKMHALGRRAKCKTDNDGTS